MDPLPSHLSLNNLAEKFFAEMTEKDGGTYDALIQGLIKVEPYLHYTTVSSIEQCLHYKAVSILSTLKAQNYIYTIQQCLHYNYVYLEC